VASEHRPDDADYYENRLQLFSQGDIFHDVPLAYPLPADEIVEDEDESYGNRRFLSGPFEVGLAMLVTPTCSMRAQGAPDRYAHPVRTLVPLRPFEDLVEAGLLDDSKSGLARKRDSLINYMYLPESEELGLSESLALLYMPVTLHHEFLEGQRVTQLAVEGARQLHRKLVWFSSSLLLDRATFEPPLD